MRFMSTLVQRPNSEIVTKLTIVRLLDVDCCANILDLSHPFPLFLDKMDISDVRTLNLSFRYEKVKSSK